MAYTHEGWTLYTRDVKLKVEETKQSTSSANAHQRVVDPVIYQADTPLVSTSVLDYPI